MLNGKCGKMYAKYTDEIYKIYFISGLGADERVFQSLSLQKSYAYTYIKWLKPFEEETLVQYVERLKVQINQHEAFVLIGVSFGGVEW